MKIKLLFYVLSYCPLWLMQALGRISGSIIYRLHSKSHRIVQDNINGTYPERSAQERQAMIKSALQHNAMTLLEIPKIYRLGAPYALSLVRTVHAPPAFQRMIKEKQQWIMLGPHLGNWEVMILYLNSLQPMVSLYTPVKFAFIERLVRQCRESNGGEMVASDSVKVLWQRFIQGRSIAVLVDQQPKHEKSGVFAPFMGREAFTMTLGDRLARRDKNLPIYTMAAVRLPHAQGFDIYVERLSNEIGTGELLDSVTAMNKALAEFIKKFPLQYQWSYPRFKRQKKNINASP